MKAFALAMVLMFGSIVAQAAPICPTFPTDLSEEEGVKQLRSFKVDGIADLTTALQRDQILQTARWYSKFIGEPQPTTAEEAVNWLKGNSEAADLYYKVFRFEKKIYVEVVHFPGGNPYGLVFSGATAIATRTDGDVNCY